MSSSRYPEGNQGPRRRDFEQGHSTSLAPAGIPILSEESGETPGRVRSEFRFIVDPLDGTFNFVKGLGRAPFRSLFGKIRSRSSGWCIASTIAASFGGAGLGLMRMAEKSRSPARLIGRRLRFAQDSLCASTWQGEGHERILDQGSPYAKVRMVGSARLLFCMSQAGRGRLLRGKHHALDVAAGLAIVEGAGGRIRCIEDQPSIRSPFAHGTGLSRGRLRTSNASPILVELRDAEVFSSKTAQKPSWSKDLQRGAVKRSGE